MPGMRIALIADIHGNREACIAVLRHVRDQGVDRIVVLGDIVGYGADPAFTVETVEQLAAEGALTLMGNHDAAIGAPKDNMSELAALALDWTRGKLEPAHRAFLAGLPMSAEEDDRLYVHASAAGPASWPYILEARAAERSLAATRQRVTFVGHTHMPVLFHAPSSGRAESFVPVPGAAVPLLARRRWVVVVGSVGQPRDGVPAAAYALYDTGTSELKTMRVPYDVDGAAHKIRAAGLPEFLAARLKFGR